MKETLLLGLTCDECDVMEWKRRQQANFLSSNIGLQEHAIPGNDVCCSDKYAFLSNPHGGPPSDAACASLFPPFNTKDAPLGFLQPLALGRRAWILGLKEITVLTRKHSTI